jgi:hypothetical protein
MALFDNNPLYNNISSLTNPVTSGLGNLFDGMSVFGTSIPSGILDTAQEEKLRKQALLQGLLGTAATYLATPKNLNTGSALPYLGKAFLGGMGASQNTIDQALNTAYRNKILTGKEDNIRTYEKDRQKITEQFDPTTKTWTVLGTSSLDAPKEAKEAKLPTSAEEFEIAKNNPAYMKFLREKWDAENKALKAGIQEQEAAYNIGRPQQSVSVTAGGKTYYFKDQNSANAFRQKAGIK